MGILDELRKRLLGDLIPPANDLPSIQNMPRRDDLPPVVPQTPVDATFTPPPMPGSFPVPQAPVQPSTAFRDQYQAPVQPDALQQPNVLQQTPYPVLPEQPATPQPVATQPIYPRLPSAETSDEINAIGRKDYSKAVYDESGNMVKPAGANRDKKWSTLEKFGNAALGALIGLGTGGIGGAIVGGVRGGTDRNFNEKLADKKRLSELYPRLQQEQQAEAFNTQQAARKAQTEYTQLKPELEREKIQSKFNLESQKQINRLQTIVEKDRLAGKKYKVEVRADGRLVKKYPDREEPFLNEKGEQEYSLLDRPEAVQVEDGVNPDGTKKYKTIYMKGGQYANLKSNEAYRDAVFGLNKDKFEYQKEKDEADRQQQIKLLEIRQNFERERDAYNLAVKQASEAKNDAEKREAEARAEESRKRILDYQNQLQQQIIDYKEDK